MQRAFAAYCDVLEKEVKVLRQDAVVQLARVVRMVCEYGETQRLLVGFGSKIGTDLFIEVDWDFIKLDIPTPELYRMSWYLWDPNEDPDRLIPIGSWDNMVDYVKAFAR